MEDDARAALRARFLEGMSHTAATVNVITTDGPAGRAGVTVSAMSSVSADTAKPSLLVCIHHLSPAAEKIAENGVFCVNVLRDDQSHISDAFAGRVKTADGDKFSCARWTALATGAPRVVDPLVAFDCEARSAERVGTHFVFIGEVQEIFTAPSGSPLIFANRAYGSSIPLKPAVAAAGGGGETLKLGCFHTFGPYLVPALIARLMGAGGDVDVRVAEGDQRAIVSGLLAGEIDVGLLYDLDLPGEIEAETLTALAPYALLAEGHPLAGRGALSLEELASEPLILLDGPPSRDYFLSIFEAAGVTPRLGHSSTSFEIVRGLVGHGLGYALLATKPASAMTYDGKALVTRPLAAEAPESRVALARKAGAAPTPASERFTEICRAHFGIENRTPRAD